MLVPIESRNDYELYVDKKLKESKLPLAMKREVKKSIMHGFDSGVRMLRKDLKVEVFTL